MADFFATTGVDTILGGGGQDFIYVAPDQVQVGDTYGGDYDIDFVVLAAPGAGNYAWDLRGVIFSEIEGIMFGAAGAGTLSFTVDANQVDDGNYALPVAIVGSSATDQIFVTLSSARIFFASPVNLISWTDGVDTVNMVGSSGDDQMGGTAYGDVLTGNAGADVLGGEGGADTMDGGAGADTMSGGTGNDVYIVDDAGDVATENAGEGTDTVQSSVSFTLGLNVENLVLTGALAINGTGNGDANSITGNGAANVLDGGAGADTLIGGAGDDTYYVDNSGDVVTEASASGTDTVHASVTYTLAANVENLILDGSTAINGTGNSDNNTITGNSAANTLDGGAGNDTMLGGAGDDTYVVSVAGDVVTENASEGTDTVQASLTYTLGANVENLTLTGSSNINGTGNTLDNVLTGNTGNNTLTGGAGADTLTGGGGADTMVGGTGDDVYFVDSTSDVVTESSGEGTDTVNSSVTLTLSNNVENLILTGSSNINGTGNSGANTITGNSGNNALSGGTGADTLIGGAGNDTYTVDNIGDVVTENAGEGTDSVNSSVSYTLSANVENLTLSGAGNNNATGNSDANTLTGNSGNNILDGAAGADTMAGDGGNDTYYVDDAGDVVTESSGAGTGTDTVHATISYTLAANVENLILDGTAANGTGNSLANTLTGNASNNILDGATGADTMAGDGGDDTYYVDNAGDVVTENAASGTDSVHSTISYTLGANVENLVLDGTAANGTGNADANSIIGNASNNVIDGGAGADTMAGDGGDDTYYVDDAGDVVTEGGASGTDTVHSTISYTLGANVENLILDGTAANGTGNADANSITGNASNNVLDGAAGADTMAGDGGDDTYYVDDAGDVVTEGSASGTDTVHSTISYTLTANVENLILDGTAANGTGNADANSITGNASSNVLDGAAGADTMAGGAGDDTYYVDNASDVVTENAGEGADTVHATVSYTLGAEIESLVLDGSSAIDGTGNALSNTITGNGANNVLDGGAGIDTLIGGAGDDSYYVNSSTETVTELAGEGTDTIYAQGWYALSANVENLVLLNSTVMGVGNDLNNVITGNGANNSLDGSTGADTLIGGLGNDSYFVDSALDVVTENAGEGTDTVYATASFTLSANVEQLALMGTDAINGTGNNDNNFLNGNSAANTLQGLNGADNILGQGGDDTLLGDAGIDTLQGGDGADTLDGGSGADLMYGGAGNDTFYVDDVGDQISDTSGVDTVISSINKTLNADVENLTLTGAATYGAGNASANVITGNANANMLDGGAGADTLIGGAGNDSYYVDNSLDVVTEASGEGTDTVYATASFTLSDNVERLGLTGAAAIDGTGNGGDNLITGNSAANVLHGMDGADTLIGQAGDDALYGDAGVDTLQGGDGADTLDGGAGGDLMYGGTGNDTYYVDSASDQISETGGDGVDTVISSVSRTLGAGFEDLTLMGAATNGFGNADNNVITGNANNNIIDGGAGADTLIGGAGNDNYYVDAANDVVTELSGEGTDTVIASASYVLSANVERLTLAGSAAIDGTGNDDANFIVGNGANNTILGAGGNDTIMANAGNDVIDGGTGADTMYGGLGDDTYVVDNAGDVASESGGDGVDTVNASVSYALSAGIENLVLLGGAVSGLGNSSANSLTGNALNNVLNGGAGADTMIGGAGDDVYYVDNTGDVVTELAGEGTDFVASSVTYTLADNVERLTLTGAAAISGTGNGDANILTGNDAANTLSGGAGGDTLIGNGGNDTLDGGTGADAMYGGAGDDTYYVDNTSDAISESGGSGIDTVISTVGRTLGAGFENLTLTGSAAVNGFGNTLDNVLTGNAGANIMSGDGGSDTVAGGLGNDVLYGGAAADAFVFREYGAANADRMQDFTSGTDHVWLDHAAFDQLTVGALSADQFVAGTAALDANDHVIYDSAAGALYYDADGLGGAAQVLIATTPHGTALTASDILII